jgi:NADPH-dependent curcumin reductase CurA
MADNTQILLMERPRGALAEAHFASRSAPIPTPADGQVLVRSVLLSLDAANRAWMQGATYRAALEAGQLMSGYGLGEVTESRSPRFARGDLVLGELGWQEWCAADAKTFTRASAHRPLSHQLSVLGVTGKTAYHGLIHVPGIAAGETLLVSAAGGAVGSIVGQIGKIKGARVIGVAGGREKCEWLVRELGFDACIDYKHEDLAAQLKRVAPEGIDVYFDNTGGAILQAALFAMKMRGRISCCGAVSQYDVAAPKSPAGVPGLLVVKRLKMEGFIVMDFANKDAEAERDLSAGVRERGIKVIEDVIDGLENAPRALIGLLAGENRGKRMIRVGVEPA